MSKSWQAMTLADLGRAIGVGEIDPVELAEFFLEKARSHEYSDRIYTRLTETRAIAEAKAARDRAKAGTRRGILDGVPVSWKDLFDTAGTETEAGSALLKGRVPKRDCAVLRNASAAGLVCLGKTHMSELAFSGLGLNPVTATPPCVNFPEAVSGGSSSGAAASVAFGLAPGAVGSDTGGSVRIPAAWNDLVGLKTTAGLLSLEGVVPLAKFFDTVGPLCRTVEDAALLLSVLGGMKAPDLSEASLNGKRLMALRTVAMDDLRPGAAKGFEEALSKLSAAGADVITCGIEEVGEAMDYSAVLYTTEAYAEWQSTIEASPDLMFKEVLKRFRAGASFSGTEYLQARKRLDELRDAYLARTAGFDAVILPTCPILPPDKTRLETDEAFYVTENLLALRNTRIANLMGLTAITLPTGVASAGIMLQSPPGSEMRLLRLAKAAESALA